jgi:hyperosmotically inducible periplasmic protein
MNLTRSIALSIAVAALAAGSAGPTFAAEEGTEDYPADNTGRNVRDRDDATLTPEDQSEKKADRELSQKIRSAVVEDDSLSLKAHNVKIITVDGRVTLRGPVANERERKVVAQKAIQIAGAGKVNNQLEVAAKN